MSFRRIRNDWDEFISRYRDLAIATGIPFEIVTDKQRFHVFLDHGYDEWGWFENKEDFFSSNLLTECQFDALKKFVALVDAKYVETVETRWKQKPN